VGDQVKKNTFLIAGLALASRLRKSHQIKAVAGRSVVKSAGKPGDGSLEPDESRLQALY